MVDFGKSDKMRKLVKKWIKQNTDNEYIYIYIYIYNIYIYIYIYIYICYSLVYESFSQEMC